MMQKPLVVEFDTDVRTKFEITEDMIPETVEMVKGDTIRFRDHVLVVGICHIHHERHEIALLFVEPRQYEHRFALFDLRDQLILDRLQSAG